MKSITPLFLALSLVLSLPASAPAQTANDLFQQALAKERTEGNLPEAIMLYQRIVDKYGTNHKVAAEALLQLAGCQSKLGDTQARKSLERLVRDFGDQKETVAEASRRLEELGGGSAPRQQTMRAVWTGPKADGSESSLSPDARFISFPDWDSGNLGLHELATGTDRLLTNTGTMKGKTAYAEVSAFSKDGKQVAYAWYDGEVDRYELRVLNLDGNAAPRRVFGNTSVQYLEPHDWSTDGKWIAVLLAKQTEQIGLIAVQDGSLRELKSAPDGLRLGRFSPDGKYLLYTHGRAANSRCYILSTDAKSDTALLPGTSSVESPVWTPDGSRIIFVSDLSGAPGLWSIRVTDGKPVGEPELLKAGFDNVKALAFARDGSLFYEVGLDDTDIYLAGLDRASGKLISEPRRINERVTNSWGRVAWLPDGKSLSFWNRGPVASLVEHILATGEEREIWGGKSARTSRGYAGWFPDGRTLMAVVRESGAKPWVLSRVDSRTGEVEKSWTLPALPPGARAPVYSPDLMTMFFFLKNETLPCDGPTCTWVMLARDVQTGQDREVFRTTASDPGTYAISRDGRRVAIMRALAGATTVMVAPAAGGPPREIYRGAEDIRFGGLCWTQDSSHILALHRLPSGGEIWSLPVSGGSPEKSPLRMTPSEQPAVSPDGTQVAFVGGNKRSEIWVMTGLLPEAKPARGR